jgi:aspartate beta-hydroxylase
MTLLYDKACDAIGVLFDRRIEAPAVLGVDSCYPNARLFVGAWAAIRREALLVAGRLESVPRFHEIMPEQTHLSANDGQDWRMFIVKCYGVVVPRNMGRCPVLAALLAKTPEVLSASFSILAPGKHIPRHRGPFRGIIRFQLGLVMPRGRDGRPAAVLKIEDTEHRLAEGECLLWDDTFPHEVWNASDEVRIILSLDVHRPAMPLDMRALSRVVVAIVQLGMRLRGASFSR